MGSNVGSVNVIVNAKLVQFQSDMKNATGVASRETRKMSQEMKESSKEAKGSLELLGEQIGLHIPRELRTVIAEIPGVGTALSAAFSSIAVVALLGLVVEIAKKIQEYREKLEEVKKAHDEFTESGTTGLRKLDQEVLGLKAELDELRGNHLKALKEQMELLNLQTFDRVIDEFKKLEKETDELLDKLKVGGFSNFFGGGNNDAVTKAKDDLEEVIKKTREIRDTEKDSQVANQKIRDLLKEHIDYATSYLKISQDEFHDSDAAYKTRQDAFAFELEALKDMSARYNDIKQARDLKTTIVQENEHNALVAKQIELQREFIKSLEDRTKAATTGAGGELETIDKLIAEWTKYKEVTESSGGTINVMANTAINALNKEKDAILAAGQEALKLTAQLNQQKGIGAPDAAKGTKPIFAGNPQDLEIDKIKKGDVDAIQKAHDKVIESIQTENQKYKEQLELLKALKDQGVITQTEYDKAAKKAHDSMDKTSQKWKEFGKDVGDTIAQAAIFGSSWSDTLKAVLVKLIELVLEMTLFKKAADDSDSDSGGGGGIGGFFSSIFKGIGSIFGGHRAGGGPILAGHEYVVGENGPERVRFGSDGTISPNGSGGSVINIDARGADAGVEQRIRRAIRDSQKQTLTHSVIANRELARRS